MKILLTTDGSESAQAAVDFLDRLPFPKDCCELTLLTVIDKSVFTEEEAKGLSEERRRALRETEKVVREEGDQLLASEAERLRKAGWAGSTEVRIGHPAEEIVHAAERLDSDLVVVGSHGRTGIQRFLLGSVSDYVLEYAPCSVLIVRTPGVAGLTPAAADREGRRFRILLAFDDSQPAKKAVEFCASLPVGDQVEVSAISVLPLVTMYRQDIRQRLSWVWHEKKKAAQEALEWVTKEARWATPHVTAELRESSDVSHEILDVATEMNSDLIMLGHKGKGAIEKFLLGSVTTRIAHHAPCSVLAVRK